MSGADVVQKPQFSPVEKSCTVHKTVMNIDADRMMMMAAMKTDGDEDWFQLMMMVTLTLSCRVQPLRGYVCQKNKKLAKSCARICCGVCTVFRCLRE